uniref:Uncharacterized protein n=1 Tax=Panagrellus redivivus TaxID=6233 RepID=A0A7E4VS61_PANRE
MSTTLPPESGSNSWWWMGRRRCQLKRERGLSGLLLSSTSSPSVLYAAKRASVRCGPHSGLSPTLLSAR